MHPKLTCLCCDKQLQPVVKRPDCYQPMYGLIATACGNYGSARFDPMDGSGHLLFFVCDDCLVAKQDAVYYVEHSEGSDYLPEPARGHV